MKNIKDLISNFFIDLKLWEDENNGKRYEFQIKEAIDNFMKTCNFDTAFEVYKSFFEAYYIGTQDSENPFIQLINKMKEYEENAGVLLDKHRDHYCHSVNVFILGLAIYKGNNNIRDMINKKILDKSIYRDSYDTNQEEFFYRWGLAALFHDIAYPLEITLKQIQVYSKFISSYSDALSGKLDISLKIDNEEFNKLHVLSPLALYNDEFKEKYPDYESFALNDSIDILAYNISMGMDIAFETVKNNLIEYTKNMFNAQFIDHGYFSALIILKWYHKLYEDTKWNPAYFYFPVADAATSILLHNYYKHGLMKSNLQLDKLDANINPLAFLLILCDEIQDWDRKAYGEQEKVISKPKGCTILVSDISLHITYKFIEGGDYNDYLTKRREGLESVISLESSFIEGVKFCCGKE